MFSSTTIAASTTMPTANASPAREMTLIDRPSMAMATNAPMTDTGMEIEMISVARKDLKKSSSISAASVPPIQIFCCTRSIADSM